MAKVNTRKRGSSWQYYFESAKVGGKRRQVVKSGFRTKKDAEAAGAKALAEYSSSGMRFEPSEVSVADYFDYWLREHVAMNMRPRTIDFYTRVVENNIKPNLGAYRLKALTPSTMQDFVNRMVLHGYSRSMVVNIKGVASGALDYAVHPLGYIASNPMRYVRNPKIDKEPRHRRVITQDEMAAILARFPEGSHFGLAIRIGYHTGLRIGEVYGLTWDDIDLEARTVRVERQLLKIRGRWLLAPPKTKSSRRTVRIGETLANALHGALTASQAYAGEYGDEYTAQYLKGDEVVQRQIGDGVALQRLRMVNVREDGRMLTPESFKYASRVIRYTLGIDGFDFHCLRHTHATLLVENGANIKDVQERLGHNRIETTLQTYTHGTDKMAQDSADIFERVTSGSEKGCQKDGS